MACAFVTATRVEALLPQDVVMHSVRERHLPLRNTPQNKSKIFANFAQPIP